MREVGAIIGRKGTSEILLVDGKLMTYEKEQNSFDILRTEIEDLDLVDDELEAEVRGKLLNIFNKNIKKSDENDLYVLIYSNEIKEDGDRKCYYASVNAGWLEVWINEKTGEVSESKKVTKLPIKIILDAILLVLTKGLHKYFKSSKLTMMLANRKGVKV